ncbi:MAG: DUF5672 family protein [Steroidobacteraceae bacterium]
MISSKQEVCVVIPVYSTQLSLSEQKSLEQGLAILGQHPVYLVKPQHLDIAPLLNRYPQLRSETFADDYFTSVKDYNRMMLADDFYARFAQYEYMLVYQLDAYVFSDQLLAWCRRGYDYIGAPWLPPGATPGKLQRRLIDLRRQFYRLLDRYVDCGDHTKDPQFTYSVGNGGFSLRRIAALRKVLQELDARAQRHRDAHIRAWPEDQFFSVEANRYRRRLRIPDAEEGAFFAWETNPDVAMRITAGALPFGCHAWNKLHRQDWQPIFARFNVELNKILDGDTRS